MMITSLSLIYPISYTAHSTLYSNGSPIMQLTGPANCKLVRYPFTLKKASEGLADRVCNHWTQAVSNSLWAYAKLGYNPGILLLDVAAQKAAGMLHQYTSQELANTVWALAMLEHHPGAAMLNSAATQIARRMDQFSTQVCTCSSPVVLQRRICLAAPSSSDLWVLGFLCCHTKSILPFPSEWDPASADVDHKNSGTGAGTRESKRSTLRAHQ